MKNLKLKFSIAQLSSEEGVKDLFMGMSRNSAKQFLDNFSKISQQALESDDENFKLMMELVNQGELNTLNLRQGILKTKEALVNLVNQGINSESIALALNMPVKAISKAMSDSQLVTKDSELNKTLDVEGYGEFKYLFVSENEVKTWNGLGRTPLELQDDYEKFKAGECSAMNPYLILENEENKKLLAEFLIFKKGVKGIKVIKARKYSDRTKPEFKFVYLDGENKPQAWKGRGVSPLPMRDAHKLAIEEGDRSKLNEYLITHSEENQMLFNSFCKNNDIDGGSLVSEQSKRRSNLRAA